MSLKREILVLATQNEGKRREISEKLSGLPVEAQSLAQYAQAPNSLEPYATYLENARDKARLIAEHTGHWALADDSGLEVPALGGAPGVQSARYAGPNASYADNNEKLLRELAAHGAQDRRAVFRCCMVLRNPEGKEVVTEGELWGEIIREPRGKAGFGYDPIFFVPRLGKTLAEISLEEKNQLSHRSQALEKMKQELARIFS